MAAPRKYGDDVREAIHILINEEGVSAPETERRLREQFPESPALPRIREIARDEARARKPLLSTENKEHQLRELLAGLVDATNSEISRLQAEKGPIDADQLLKLANTVKTLEPLLKPEPSKDQGNKPASFLSALPETHAHTDTDTNALTNAAGSADRSLRTRAA